MRTWARVLGLLAAVSITLAFLIPTATAALIITGAVLVISHGALLERAHPAVHRS